MSTEDAAAARPAPPSAWAPLGQAVFRSLWIAGLASDFGSWMHEVGEGWLMTSLSPSPLSVALLQSADGLAIFLLAIPAGALADIVDRRRLAIVTQAWLMVMTALLGTLTLVHRVTPSTLIGLTFLVGVGSALDGPLWQAIVSEVVPRRDLPRAVSLGGLSINLARAFAPALGGLVVAATGPAGVFLLNAATFVFVIVALVRWRRVKPRRTAPAERWIGAISGGLRFVRNSPELLGVFARTAATLFGGICLLALLPLVARRSLHLGSAGFGVLLGCMGVGAVTSAVLLPRAEGKLSSEAVLSAGTLVFAAGLLGVALAPAAWIAGCAMTLAGLAWMSILSSLNVAVQLATPSWVRGRVLSVFLLVFQGALSLGSVAWGALASRTDLRTAMMAGAGAVAASLLARVWFPLSNRVPDFSPAAWPKPALVCEPPLDLGPVLVTIEYRVAPAHVSAFAAAAAELEQLRRRGGAFDWDLYRDPATTDGFVEAYYVDSWGEHLRQHERVTVEERDAEKRVTSFLVEGTERIVRHLVPLPDDDDDGGDAS